MIALSVAEVARITGGEVVGLGLADASRVIVDGPVVTDSREAGPGSLYIARIGASMDGHAFVPGAAALGAVAALVTRPVAGLPCVVVDDDQRAFAALARHLVDTAVDLTVIGITGSSGKTSTKDLLADVLRAEGETVAPVGSLNSEVGVPLTVCRITASTLFLIVEMGARGRGHISYLTQIAPPRIGAVLNVGVAHIGEFGSREAIATAKAELVEALPAEGVAVLNGDDPVVRAMATRTTAEVVLVGEAADAAVRAVDVTLDDEGRARFRLVTSAGDADVRLGLVGRHHVGNALSVAAVALACGVGVADIAGRLSASRPASRWRMEVTRRSDGIVVVNDAYNANPDSMRAALLAVRTMRVVGRRWAVLGSMLELGDEADADHADIGREAVRSGVDHLLVVGAVAAPMVSGARAEIQRASASMTVRHVADVDAAYDLLVQEMRDGDVVLLKSSRDAGLRWLGERIASGSENPGVSSAQQGVGA